MMEEKLLTLDDLAEYFQVSKKTIYRLVQQKELPAVRISHQWRFRKQDVEGWIQEKMVEDQSA
ncbi:MAG TPA: helix-turn-helix domain-containing protein [bacterium]|nr:helix-turn-helix domain-containing protein [bacterium]